MKKLLGILFILGSITILAKEEAVSKDQIVATQEKTELEIHGNWVPQYKMEYFKNEGSLKNTRPVNELVFGEGTLNFGDTGFNMFYVMKRVWFDNNITEDKGQAKDITKKFDMFEMELNPGYAKTIGKHSFNVQLITLWKSGAEETYDNGSKGDTYAIRTMGYGIKPQYRYQITDNMWINGEIKALNETKSGEYYSKNGFMLYEGVANLGYKLNDSMTFGLEGFVKNGFDYSDGGYNESNYDVNETQIRPWMSWNQGKHNIFLKMEIGTETGKDSKGVTQYKSDDIKFIVAHSYPIKENLYFLSEISYRNRRNKEVGGESYGDTDVYFGKIGLNYSF
ncbi:MAG: hypothetical protein WBG30_04480 [Psychrilyobacter sp.]|uniref:hypothetical protein n=1 Tax=Psychrilyobacter sp. TaxID=2586924 RepID=UPI003C71FD40